MAHLLTPTQMNEVLKLTPWITTKREPEMVTLLHTLYRKYATADNKASVDFLVDYLYALWKNSNGQPTPAIDRLKQVYCQNKLISLTLPHDFLYQVSLLRGLLLRCVATEGEVEVYGDWESTLEQMWQKMMADPSAFVASLNEDRDIRPATWAHVYDLLSVYVGRYKYEHKSYTTFVRCNRLSLLDMAPKEIMDRFFNIKFEDVDYPYENHELVALLELVLGLFSHTVVTRDTVQYYYSIVSRPFRFFVHGVINPFAGSS